MDPIISTVKGLFCDAGKFYLDPKQPVEWAIVSHAHADHVHPGCGTIFCTPPTASIIRERYGNRLISKIKECNFRDVFHVGSVPITFYPAGHMLGSAQVLMQLKHNRILYTGDVRTVPDSSCESFEPVQADTLIIETTFSNPGYSHPPSSEVFSIISNNMAERMVIGAYAVGKAQRITKWISEQFPEITIMVHHSITPFHKVYEKHGIDLGHWIPYSAKKFKKSNNTICIAPPLFYRSYKPEPGCNKMFATGWKSNYPEKETLPVSDHADWEELLKIISLTGAAKVFTVHGDGNFLKAHFLSSDIEVSILA
jgi:putative mRNA 3-end processing factor